ncbi:MAG: lipopolysaccharide heptosyltransferase I, partial [Desulfuromusa sp.]|nr:lipopolysaccharide heptosyltransferase I [Desulfuromusa sp.]
MKVLIVKVSALGDVIHTLPVLAYLHSACSDIEIDWLVEEGFFPVLNGHPLIRQVIPLQTKRWRHLSSLLMLRELWRFARQLRQRRYDLVFDLQGNSKSGLFTLISRGRDKYGFDRHQVREWPNLLATRHHIALSDSDHHVAQRALAIVRAALPEGKDLRSSGPLQVLPEAREVVEQQLQQLELLNRSLVVLHYGTTWQTKLWSLESWQQLAIRLVKQDDLLPLLTWGNDEELKAVTIIADATAGRAIIWPRGSLPELVAL